MTAGLLGQMVTPNSGNRLRPDVTWALDNGCFGDQWKEAKWEAALAKYQGSPGCLFAVVPDVVCDADATSDRWERYVDTVTSYGYRPAFVTQNGCDRIPDDAAAVFTGGDNAWKLGARAQQLVATAKARGLWTHMGRVNSLRRLRFAFFHGYDSVDGTFLAFGPDVNLPRLLRNLTAAHHPTLFGGTT
jgi:hypothetical protein